MPKVKRYIDYYPFGSLMPGRNSNSGDYAYGFQGQLIDNEIKGTGNSINFEYRMHDPRLGRFLSIDPLAAKYPHYTPYSFSGNRVIDCIELEGLEEFHITMKKDPKTGKLYNASVTRKENSWLKNWFSGDYVEKQYYAYFDGEVYNFSSNGYGYGTNGDLENFDEFKADPNNSKWISEDERAELCDQIFNAFNILNWILPSKLETKKNKTPYVPKEKDGTPRKLKTNERGKAIVDEEAKGKSHTQLGTDKTGKYPQRRTVDEKGNRVKDIDYHGGTDKEGKSIPNPHQHKYDNSGKRDKRHEPPSFK